MIYTYENPTGLILRDRRTGERRKFNESHTYISFTDTAYEIIQEPVEYKSLFDSC
jgi:hypothetical protein